MTSSSHPSYWPLRFISVEAASGVVLLVAAAVALAWANSAWGATYQQLWHLKVPLSLGALLPARDLHFWVNDGLMSVFFLVVGLEVRRELHDGSLSDPRVATLPIIAAAGGVLMPALLYVLVNTEPATRHGWAIPTATDIAFAVGVLALCGPRLPGALRMLLLTLAIIDDIAAILVIALVYSGGIEASGFAIAAAGVALAFALQALGVRAASAYIVPGAIVWYGMLSSGVHPTLSGAILGLMTPVRARFGLLRSRTPLAPGTLAPVVEVEARLHPFVAFGIMPLFALANAGVVLAGLDLGSAQPLALGGGIVLGLFVGKPFGIMLASWAAVRLKWCALPAGVRWPHMLLLGLLGGIGFTMSIFIANLAFTQETLLAAAKFAVLTGSAAAALAGLTLGRLGDARRQSTARTR
ncbi:MAG TPA: Na+/H+ antiporter NhaA [Steroidobacteraceae bacterium]|nr:Na+/H+ antiporter NhaA [Steroidobacteraceae bacterium]